MAAIALRQRIRKIRKRASLRDETRSELDEEDHPEIGQGVIRRLRRVKPHDVPQGVVLVPGKTNATKDDTPHPIANVGEVPLSHVGQKGKLMNVLHVPTITKNLVSVEQIVDQGMEKAKLLRTLDVASRKKAKLLRKGAETGGCSSSTLVTVAAQCSQRDKKSSRISTYGTSG